MKYSRGDVVKFKVGRDGIDQGDVQFVEKEVYYINSFSGWAFKVPKNNIIAKI